MEARRLLGIAAFLVVATGLDPTARAQSARAVEAAKGYTTQFNLPERRIVTGPADRRVTRIVVPVLEHTYDGFVARLSEPSGSVVLHGIPDKQGHVVMMRRPGDLLLWARQHLSGYGSFGAGESRGHLIVLQLEPGELTHLNGWLDDRTRDALYSQGNCLEWLPNAEVGPGKPIFHALGLTRSKDGHNIRKKLLRAANDKVAIVGVKVGSVEEFRAMSDDQLLGPAPAGGIEDSVR
jgi:hypothetical protein